MIPTMLSVKRFQLARLEYALRVRQDAGTAYAERLADGAIVSLYLACGDAGMGDKAHALLAQYVGE